MDDVTEPLESARDAFRRRDWPAALEGFSVVRQNVELSAEDLSALGDCAWWLGDIDQAMAAYEGAYRLYLQGGEQRGAAVNALGLAVALFLRGEIELGSGWMNRAERLLRDEPEAAEHGYLIYLDTEAAFEQVQLDEVIVKARVLGEMGRRYGDANLAAGGVLFEGRALIRQGRLKEGMAFLDEAMVSVLSDEMAPEWAGNVYCHLMAVFHELIDIRRAAEWVAATAQWVETLPAAVLFTAICRVHRSQVLQITGAWNDAEREAERVCLDLAHIHVAGQAEGHYQVGEIQRLRGELAAAKESYERAHECGRDPQPGLALLRLAERRLPAATASIQAALVAESNSSLARAPLCAAQIDIALAAGNIDMAQRACEELEATSSVFPTSGLEAMARHARGAVALAEGLPESALSILRDACRRWRELGADYNASRACVLLASAYEALGDADAARRELDAAASVFDRLGAVPDARRVEELRGKWPLPGGLTEREAQVLGLVAIGRTNKEVAEELSISQKTVARHVSNIFNKLGASSRTEAAAYAFEHGLAASARG
ncbi:MAG: LuxR C-terminal-related transcriptional regulator [Actinomycetota bacterium]|nr:LuxR C-terminal-related transcriptional regulator [Actinomycetota bacterium]